jgi:hypothetical protein
LSLGTVGAGDVTFTFRGTGGETVVTKTGSYGDGAWHLAVGMVTSSNACISIDGGAWTNTAHSDSVGLYNTVVFAQDRLVSAGSRWVGNLDEAAYWNTLISTTNLTELYNTGKGVTMEKINLDTVTLTGGTKPAWAWGLNYSDQDTTNTYKTQIVDMANAGGILLNGEVDARGPMVNVIGIVDGQP